MKFLMIADEDLEDTNIDPQLVNRNAHYIDRIMGISYVHAGNKYCSWFSLQLPNARYCDIEITVF